MSVSTHNGHNRRKTCPQGHLAGVVDTTSECIDVVKGLKEAGFADSAVMLLSGVDGIHFFEGLMNGSLWSEMAESILQQFVSELEEGHFVFLVDVEDRDEATIAARISAWLGGHSFYHFGLVSFFKLSE